MKHAQTLILLGLLCVTGSAMAATDSSTSAPPKVLPVLVHVDATGEVTDVAPAVELRPDLEKMLRQTVDRLVTKPAVVNHKPVASQFVMNLAIKTTPRKDGSYDMRFEYVSSEAVPNGSWHWVRQSGRAPVLAPRGVSDFRHQIAQSHQMPTRPNYGMTPVNRPRPQPRPPAGGHSH